MSLRLSCRSLSRAPLAHPDRPLRIGWNRLVIGLGVLALAAAAPAVAIMPGEIVINEVLFDGSTSGDPNGDGSMNSIEDEFVELVNVSGIELDLTGVTLTESDFDPQPRHVFGPTSLAAGEAIVVFGGGTPTGSFGGAQVVVCSTCSAPGINFGLALDDDEETLTLRAADTTLVDEVSWTPGTASDESITRFPEARGAFVPHTSVPGSVDNFSVGTRAIGAPFPIPALVPLMDVPGIPLLLGLLLLIASISLGSRRSRSV